MGVVCSPAQRIQSRDSLATHRPGLRPNKHCLVSRAQRSFMFDLLTSFHKSRVD